MTGPPFGRTLRYATPMEPQANVHASVLQDAKHAHARRRAQMQQRYPQLWLAQIDQLLRSPPVEDGEP